MGPSVVVILRPQTNNEYGTNVAPSFASSISLGLRFIYFHYPFIAAAQAIDLSFQKLTCSSFQLFSHYV